MQIELKNCKDFTKYLFRFNSDDFRIGYIAYSNLYQEKCFISFETGIHRKVIDRNVIIFELPKNEH